MLMTAADAGRQNFLAGLFSIFAGCGGLGETLNPAPFGQGGAGGMGGAGGSDGGGGKATLEGRKVAVASKGPGGANKIEILHDADLDFSLNADRYFLNETHYETASFPSSMRCFGGKLFLIGSNSNNVTVLDSNNPAQAELVVNLGSSPLDLWWYRALDGGEKVYVTLDAPTSNGLGDIAVFDPIDGVILKQISLQKYTQPDGEQNAFASALVQIGGLICVALRDLQADRAPNTYGRIVCVNPEVEDHVIEPPTVLAHPEPAPALIGPPRPFECVDPYSMAFSAAQNRLYVACRGGEDEKASGIYMINWLTGGAHSFIGGLRASYVDTSKDFATFLAKSETGSTDAYSIYPQFQLKQLDEGFVYDYIPPPSPPLVIPSTQEGVLNMGTFDFGTNVFYEVHDGSGSPDITAGLYKVLRGNNGFAIFEAGNKIGDFPSAQLVTVCRE